MDFRSFLIEDEARIQSLIRRIRRVAVLGIKTAEQASQPAYYVPEYLAQAGLEIVPVPVYFPDVTEILGQKVYRKLSDIPGPIDLVNIFRRPQDLEAHLEDLLAKKPTAVWMQLGISHAGVAQKLAEAGIEVVQNRCLLVDHRRYA